MHLNGTQKAGLVIGGLSSLYLTVWVGLTFVDYIDEQAPSYLDNCDSQEMNHLMAQVFCLIAPLAVATGMHAGLAATTAVTARNSQEYTSTMNNAYQNVRVFFGRADVTERPERGYAQERERDMQA
ncbi:MAG: hypothetical protein P1U39_05510 [Legionellaceae bacterium]|nr:hypothetical protein [Legionellaceae bacterium]